LASATAVDLATDLLRTPKISLKSSLYSGALWKRLSVGSALSSYTLTTQSDAPPAPAVEIDQRSLPPPASSNHLHSLVAPSTHPFVGLLSSWDVGPDWDRRPCPPRQNLQLERERKKNTQRDSKYSEVIGKRVLEDKFKTTKEAHAQFDVANETAQPCF